MMRGKRRTKGTRVCFFIFPLTRKVTRFVSIQPCKLQKTHCARGRETSGRASPCDTERVTRTLSGFWQTKSGVLWTDVAVTCAAVGFVVGAGALFYATGPQRRNNNNNNNNNNNSGVGVGVGVVTDHPPGVPSSSSSLHLSSSSSLSHSDDVVKHHANAKYTITAPAAAAASSAVAAPPRRGEVQGDGGTGGGARR